MRMSAITARCWLNVGNLSRAEDISAITECPINVDVCELIGHSMVTVRFIRLIPSSPMPLKYS